VTVAARRPDPARPAEPELDEVTLRRAQRGESAAWRALIERYQRPVFALLGRMLKHLGSMGQVLHVTQPTIFSQGGDGQVSV
jgi:hypothetical protein